MISISKCFIQRKTHAEIPGMRYGLDKSLGIQAFSPYGADVSTGIHKDLFSVRMCQRNNFCS